MSDVSTDDTSGSGSGRPRRGSTPDATSTPEPVAPPVDTATTEDTAKPEVVPATYNGNAQRNK